MNDAEKMAAALMLTDVWQRTIYNVHHTQSDSEYIKKENLVDYFNQYMTKEILRLSSDVKNELSKHLLWALIKKELEEIINE